MTFRTYIFTTLKTSMPRRLTRRDRNSNSGSWWWDCSEVPEVSGVVASDEQVSKHHRDSDCRNFEESEKAPLWTGDFGFRMSELQLQLSLYTLSISVSIDCRKSIRKRGIRLGRQTSVMTFGEEGPASASVWLAWPLSVDKRIQTGGYAIDRHNSRNRSLSGPSGR